MTPALRTLLVFTFALTMAQPLCAEPKSAGSYQDEARRYEKSLVARFGLSRDRKAIGMVSEIGARIAKATGSPAIRWKFKLLNSPIVNACAFPDGTIYVFKGLVDAVHHDREELAGVLGHEIGHVKHFHMFLYLAVLALGATLFEGVSGAVRLVYSDWTKAHPDLFTALPITALGMYVFAIFGFLSRKCERQADIFGCKALSCENPHCDGHPSIAGTPFEGQLCPTGIRTFASALRRVAEMGGHSNEALKWRDYPLTQKPVWLFERLVTALNTWQHSTIEKRIRYLERLAAHPEEEVGFQRRVFAGKVALLFVLLAGISALGIEFGWSIFVGDGV